MGLYLSNTGGTVVWTRAMEACTPSSNPGRVTPKTYKQIRVVCARHVGARESLFIKYKRMEIIETSCNIRKCKLSKRLLLL